MAFMGAVLRPGIEVVLDMVDFDNKLKDCDLVITGKGRINGQSLGGKVPIGVSRRAKAQNVPVIAIVGLVGSGVEPAYEEGITAIFNTNRAGLPFEKIRDRGEEDYAAALNDVLRICTAVQRKR